MLVAISLISYVSLLSKDLPDFPSGEYISPEANIQLEEVVDFSTYTDPITDIMGRFSFADTETGEKWRLVLVNSDNITVMMEGEEPRIIGFVFPADNFFISHDNVYVVLTSRTATGDNALRINTETGETRLFSCCPEEVWPGTLFVGTSGSVASWYEGRVAFFDSDLVQQNSVSFRWGFLNGTNDGSVILLGASGSSLSGYDDQGNLLWARTDFPRGEQTLGIQVSDSGDECCRATNYICYRINTHTGETISRVNSSSDGYSYGFYCPGSSTLCFASKHQELRTGSQQTTAHIEMINGTESTPVTPPYSYDSDMGRTWISPSACSESGLILYRIYNSSNQILVLTDNNGDDLLTFCSDKPEQYVAGTAYGTVHHPSQGEISDSSKRICIFLPQKLMIYEIGE